MMRSGFGGKGGSISSRSTGVITTEDNSGGFLNLVRSMAGDDLVMCLDAYGVEGVAVGGTITNWYDSLGVLSTHFTQGTEANRPALALFRNKPIVNFNGSNLMTTAANMSELNGVRDCTVIAMLDHEGAAVTNLIAEYTARRQEAISRFCSEECLWVFLQDTYSPNVAIMPSPMNLSIRPTPG